MGFGSVYLPELNHRAIAPVAAQSAAKPVFWTRQTSAPKPQSRSNLANSLRTGPFAGASHTPKHRARAHAAGLGPAPAPPCGPKRGDANSCDNQSRHGLKAPRQWSQASRKKAIDVHAAKTLNKSENILHGAGLPQRDVGLELLLLLKLSDTQNANRH